MSKTKAGSNAQFTGPQKGLTVIGKHCYAYSGIKQVTGSATTFVKFTTGKGYIVAKVQPINFTATTDNVTFEIKFNGQTIQQAETTSSRDYTPYDVIHLVIPPLTEVDIILDNVSGGTHNAGVAVTGEVYG